MLAMKSNFMPASRDSMRPESRLPQNRRRYIGDLIVLLLGVLGLLLVLHARAANSTTTTLTLSASTVSSGTAVTLTAAVSNGSPVTVGTVTICDAAAAYCMNSAIIGTAQLTSTGTAIVKLVPAIGSHSYKAVFTPTKTNNGSTSPTQTLTVTGTFPTTTSISSSGAAGSYTLTGTVVGHGYAGVAPTGSVSFLDTSNGNYVLGSAALGAVTSTQTFATHVDYGTGSKQYGIVTGDFNGDGKLDLAVANYSSGTVGILKGNGDGTFQTQVTYPVGTKPYALAVGDFNGDGKLDIVVANSGDDKIGVLLGNGDGTFQPQVLYSTSNLPESVAVGDFNGDGKLDIVVGNFGADSVGILLGNGDGTFQAQVSYPVGNKPTSVAVGNFNGDGAHDVVVVSAAGVGVLTGNGDGTLNAVVNYAVGNGSVAVVVGDFNGDGIQDVAAGRNNSSISVLIGNGDGTFKPAVAYSTGTMPWAIATGDFNGDGKLDLAVTNQVTNNVSLLFGNGDGTFQTNVDFAVGTSPCGVAQGDFNGSGQPDLAVANCGSTVLSVLLNSLTQTATASVSGISVPGTGTAHLVDASYPGNTNFSGSVSSTISLTSSKAATTLTLTANPTASVYGQSVTLTATLNPSTLGALTTSGESVTFKNGASTLGTGTLNSLGVATLTLTTLPVGTDSLTAVYAGDTNFQGSTSSAVSFAVSKATLTVTANNLNRAYGAANPTFTASASGLVNGDTLSTATSGVPTFATIATSLSAVGGYTITVTLGSLASSKYTFAFVNGTLTVSPAVLTVAAINASRPYGTANPSFTYGVTGFVNGDTQASATTGAPNLATTATAASGAGAYTITTTAGTLGAINYAFAYVNGTLTVTPAVLTVTAFNAGRLVGAANPAFAYAMTGFVNGDTQGSATTGAPSLTTSATVGSPAGRYPITVAQGSLSASSYTFALVNAVLSISSTGSQSPNIQGRWEFAITSGDNDVQVAQLGQSTISSYLLQSGSSLTNIPAFNTDTIYCDTDVNGNTSVANSSIDAAGNVSITFTTTEVASPTFQFVFTGVLTTAAPTVITGTYQRSAGGCTQGHLGTGTPDGNFTATYFPDPSGTWSGSFQGPDGSGSGPLEVPATFTLTTNSDKTLSGTIDASLLTASGGAACFAGIVTLHPYMSQGSSQTSGVGIELFGADSQGNTLWVNAYSSNPDGSLAAVGEDDPADGTSGTINDGTNLSYTAFYGISGGPCDGMGGGDAPFQLATKSGKPPKKDPDPPKKQHNHHHNHRFHGHRSEYKKTVDLPGNRKG